MTVGRDAPLRRRRPLGCLHVRVGDKLAKADRYPALNVSYYEEAARRMRAALGPEIALLGFAGGSPSPSPPALSTSTHLQVAHRSLRHDSRHDASSADVERAKRLFAGSPLLGAPGTRGHGGSRGGGCGATNSDDGTSSVPLLRWAPPPSDPIVDLWAMSWCDALAVGVSSFSWWGGYLAADTALVLAPAAIYSRRGAVQVGYRPRDYYPEGWVLL